MEGERGWKKENRKALEGGKDWKGGRTDVFREGWVRLQRRFARNVDVGGGRRGQGREGRRKVGNEVDSRARSRISKPI